MDTEDNILEEGEDPPQSPAEPPAEKEELGLFVWGDRGIFEDEPLQSQPLWYVSIDTGRQLMSNPRGS